MKFIEYIKERWKTLLLLLLAVATIEIFLLLYHIDVFVRLYIVLIIVAAFLLGNFLEYYSKREFYSNILGKLEQLHEKYLIVEMIKPAEFVEGRILEEILQETNKSMLENVNAYRYIQQEYKDYIELWIHEIKLPIATCKMVIENNKNEVTKSIEEEIDEIEGFTEQALFYARSSHANKDYCVTQCRVKELVNETVKRNKQTLINDRIKIEIGDIDQTVYTDSKWLVFILNQIVQNSIKYRKPQGAEICFGAEEKQNRVVLTIRDNGIGIRQGETARVFDKGFTGSNGRTGRKSTGIGLYLCKKLCDKLGLGIGLTSTENEGTEVKIIFPKNSFSNM
ncbi:MAG: sensor histidine kinase [Lachnospiraceae bacterium]|nr:sensor histidine kinase [Lachnospiraceae bacterium]